MEIKEKFNWYCETTWSKSAYNTLWCLIGCSIGDFGTIYYFQIIPHSLSVFLVMFIAIINGIITSIILETIILSKQMKLRDAFNTAVGMSLISMLMMEISMNTLDWIVMGGAKLNLTIIPLMLFVGFITPLPFNYWRLK